MFRDIIIPKERKVEIELPQEMVGKQVEVIAFDIEKPVHGKTKQGRIPFEEAVNFYKTHAVDFSKLEKWKREDLYE